MGKDYNIGDVVVLKVKSVTSFGAFLYWGQEKDILVPGNQQNVPMQEGKEYVVRICHDDVSDRIFASAKLDRYLIREVDEGVFSSGQQVDAIVYGFTELGVKVVVDNKYSGLMYKNEIFCDLKTGDQLKAYIKSIREDGRIDVSLQAVGFKKVQDTFDVILEALEEAGGFLPYNDKSTPEEIKKKFEISKKVFKKSIGSLYKQRKIIITDTGIELCSSSDD